MSNGKPKSLNSGGSGPAGSVTNIAIVVLVVIVLVLCAGIYMLYSQNNTSSQNAQNAKQAYSALNNTYNSLSGEYSTLVTNNAILSQEYNVLNTSYSNVSGNYNVLKNQSDTTIEKVSNFVENGPMIAWRYTNLANNSQYNDSVSGLTGTDTVVTVYNVGNADASNVVVTCTIQSIVNNLTAEQTQIIPELTSMNKTSVTFTLDNTSRVQSVYAAIT